MVGAKRRPMTRSASRDDNNEVPASDYTRDLKSSKNQ